MIVVIGRDGRYPGQHPDGISNNLKGTRNTWKLLELFKFCNNLQLAHLVGSCLTAPIYGV